MKKQAAGKWHMTRKQGIRFRLTKAGDKVFYIRHQPPGHNRRIDERVGRASEGIKVSDCVSLLQELQRNQRLLSGPVTLAELRSQKTGLKKLTVSEAFDLFFENVHHRSRASELGAYHAWILPTLGRRPLASITRTDLESILKKMQSAGRRPATRRNVLTLFSTCWNWHKGQENIFGEPPQLSKSTRDQLIGPLKNEKHSYLTHDEAKHLLALLKAHPSPDPHDLALFALYSGCRFGEIAGLKWRDIQDGIAYLWKTKNNETRRIRLADPIMEMLETRKKGKPEENVFKQSNGRPYSEPPSAFRRILERSGINDGRSRLQRITFHALRHSCASFMLHGKASIAEVGKVLGHKNPRTTARYAHMDESKIKIGDYFNASAERAKTC